MRFVNSQCLLLVFLSTAWRLSATSHAAALELKDFPQQLASVRPIAIDDRRGVLFYFPCRPAFVDAAGKESPVRLIPAGPDTLLLSGRLSLVADESDLFKLKESAANLLGRGSKIELLSPSSYGMWLFLGDQKVWSRPPVGGKFEGIPLQCTLATPAAGKELTLQLVTAVCWKEPLEPVAASIKVDWKAIQDALTQEFKESDTLGTRVVARISMLAVTHRWVRLLKPDGSALDEADAKTLLPRARRILETRLTNALLAPGEPIAERRAIGATPATNVRNESGFANAVGTANAPSSDGWTVSYTLRKGVYSSSLSDVIDLSATSSVERTVILIGSITTRK
jgi:hypothetical protein